MIRPVIWSLVVQSFRLRNARTLLAIGAVMLAVTLVVGVTSGYASLEASMRGFITRTLGTKDFEFVSSTRAQTPVDQSLLAAVQGDPRVRTATPRATISRSPIRDDGTIDSMVRIRIIGVDPATDLRGQQLEILKGRWFLPGDAPQKIVLDQNVAEELKLEPGDKLTFPSAGADQTLEVVGVYRKPRIGGRLLRQAFVPIDMIRIFSPDDAAALTRIQGEFNLEVDADAFAQDWQNRLLATHPGIEVKLTRDTREKIDQTLRGMQLLSLLGGSVSMAAATFIIFTTLSMGVAERQRLLAMLRAVGAVRSQVGWLVVVEAVLMTLIGCVLGIVLGVLLLRGLIWYFDRVFTEGLAISLLGIGFAVCVSVVGALIASVLPAWRASRVDPLEAMRPLAQSGPTSPPWGWFLIGVGVCAIDSIIVFAPMPETFLGLASRDWRVLLHFGIGLPTLLLGFFLIAPMFVWLVTTFTTTPIARALKLNPDLLHDQLASGRWRSAGTASAMMVGLAVLIVMQIQGHSAIQSWKLPTKFPDVFIYSNNVVGTITRDEIARIESLEGVRPDSVMPLYVTVPSLGDNMFALATSIGMPEATMFIGVDPTRAFDLLELDWREGSQQLAQKLLTDGQAITLTSGEVLHGVIEAEGPMRIKFRDARNIVSEIERRLIASQARAPFIVITQEFAKLKGYGVGDSFTLVKGLLRRQPVDFVIAGVVWSPGIDLIINSFDMHDQVGPTTSGTVFGSARDAIEIFETTEARLVAANLALGVERLEITQQLRESLGREGMDVADVRVLKFQIESMFSQLLQLASVVAWSAMAVATLGVCNAVIASVRSRRWTIGVLRSIGQTRGELLRTILAEGFVLGLIASAMGVAAGLLMTFNARGFSTVMVGFQPPLRIPWDVIGLAIAVAMIASILASLWPALSTSRKQPLALLQAGRGAM